MNQFFDPYIIIVYTWINMNITYDPLDSHINLNFKVNIYSMKKIKAFEEWIPFRGKESKKDDIIYKDFIAKKKISPTNGETWQIFLSDKKPFIIVAIITRSPNGSLILSKQSTYGGSHNLLDDKRIKVPSVQRALEYLQSKLDGKNNNKESLNEYDEEIT